MDVLDDIAWAREHFGRSVAIYNAGGFDGDSLDAYKSRMALLQSMQSGHTSLESGLIRILDMLHEEKPTGDQFHADLIRRVSRPLEGKRPAIVSAELAGALDRTRRFRHVARKNYNDFRPAEASQAISSAAVIRDAILNAIDEFRQIIDGGVADAGGAEEG